MKSLLERDLKHIWHPYTQMKDYEESPPILIERAKGVKLYDTEGKFYYDTISSWWCNVHGHNHPKIKRAIKKQLNSLEHVLFAGFTHKPAIELAERLVSITPDGLDRVFFSDNGSTAVEAALKISFQYWQNIGEVNKRKFVSLDYGYHGDTIGTMSVSGVDLFSEVFSPLFYDSFKAPSPYCYRCPMAKKRVSCNIECLGAMEDILKLHHEHIAAMILEPMVMGAGGMIVYPKEYLERVSRMAREYNVHLILDEVATGFGRTGKMFACEHAGVKPDIICLSKGITSGYLPLGATLTTDKIFRAFYGDYINRKTFYHGHTYTANPLSCSAAIASLEIFEDDQTLKRVGDLIPLFHKGMDKFKTLDIVGDVRYIGMIGAIELVKDRETKEEFELKDRIGYRVYKEGLKVGIILRPLGNIIYFYLPLCIKKTEIDKILRKAFKVLKDLP
ncbi:MAG: adenosylmethionine--8-amino-7-oxononanoate transaminase [Candidatus Omnitrophota bacterium]